VIIAQVAVTAAFPAVAFIEQRELWRAEADDVGFHADQYLGVLLEMDATASGVSVEQADSAQHARFGAALEEVRRRLTAEPGVTGITFVDRLPQMPHSDAHVEVEDASVVQAPVGTATTPALRDSLRWVGVASIDPSYFDVLEAPMLAGRAFHGDDATSDARVAIVDEVFVKQVLQGRNAVGRRMRFYETVGRGTDAKEVPGPWMQIVGVAKDLGITAVTSRTRDPGVYLPVPLASAGPLYMAVHTSGDPMTMIPRVRAIAMSVDPALRLSELQRGNEVSSGVLWFLKLWIRITVVLTAIALLLSLAGIYAVMSFTVARRTREIGIRVALGANSRRMVASIFKRPLIQVAIGVVLGSVFAGLVVAGTEMGGGTMSVTGVGLMLLYALLILGVCLLACVVPTRRALAVEPMEALRAE